MKKTNNKGFSLVELIIVIAIMAILAGAIAPALIRYIDKSRKSNDVSSCKTIKTAVETALGNETVYELLTTGTGDFCYITVTPGKSTSNNKGADAVALSGESAAATVNGKNLADAKALAIEEIATNIGETSPKIKYKKNASGSGNAPVNYVAVVSKKGTVYVFISTTSTNFTVTADDTVGAKTTNGFQICPNVCDEYQ